MWDPLVAGLLHVFVPMNFLMLCVGVFMGIVFGALPGLTATMGLALLVPFTFTMSPAAGLIMLAGIYVGAMYGDAIPAVLINTPGTPAAIATTFDGFPLTQKGMAQHGLVAAAFASSYGSLVANVVLATAAPPLAVFSLKFGPPEYFWLGIFGLTIIASLSSGSMVKGFLAGAVGLLLSAVGMAPIGGDVRLTFGRPELQAGIELIVALIGFFCLPEIFSSVIGQRRAAYTEKTVKPEFRVVREVIVSLLKKPGLMLRSSIIGTVVGFAPGAGGNIASMVSYNEACRWDRHTEEYGKGTIKGVAASEAANSAMAPGSLIPLLTLGIPGSPPAAVILGALMLHGMRPGAELFTSHAGVTYAFIMGLLVAAFMVTLIGSFGSFIFARVINIPSRFLAPAIIFMTVLGSYAIRNNVLDIWVMFTFGIAGYISSKLKFHPAPIVLGLILGPFVEEGLVQSMLAGQATGSVFKYMVFRPISLVLIAMTLLSAAWPFYADWRTKRRKSADSAVAVTKKEDDHED
ncbi:MAG: tripartite tricarboxylate transporter permease [Desulfobacterales bacterium]